MPLDAALCPASVVLLDPRRVCMVAQLGVEALAVRHADRLGMGAQVRVLELVLVLEEAVVHLPEAALGGGWLGSLGGEGSWSPKRARSSFTTGYASPQ